MRLLGLHDNGIKVVVVGRKLETCLGQIHSHKLSELSHYYCVTSLVELL